MKNFVQAGDTLTVETPADGVLSGDCVLIGKLFGVAAYTAPATAPLEIMCEGVFDLPKADGAAFAAGDAAYFDAATKTIGAQAEGRLWVGVVTQGAALSAANVRIRLNAMPIQ